MREAQGEGLKRIQLPGGEIQLVEGDVAVQVERHIHRNSFLQRLAAPYSFGVPSQPRNTRISLRLYLRLRLILGDSGDGGLRGCGGFW